MPQLRCHGLCFQKRVLQMPHEERWNKGTVPNWDIHDDDDDDEEEEEEMNTAEICSVTSHSSDLTPLRFVRVISRNQSVFSVGSCATKSTNFGVFYLLLWLVILSHHDLLEPQMDIFKTGRRCLGFPAICWVWVHSHPGHWHGRKRTTTGEILWGQCQGFSSKSKMLLLIKAVFFVRRRFW